MKTQILIALMFVVAASSGWAIAQVDPLSESVDTIQDIELAKNAQLFDLQIATTGFDAEIQAKNNEITVAETGRDIAKSDLVQKLAAHQALLNQVIAELNSP